MANPKKRISSATAAELLQIPIEDVEKLKRQEVLHVVETIKNVDYFSTEEVERITANKGITVAQQAKVVEAQILSTTVTSLSTVQKILIGGGVIITGYLALAAVLVLLFLNFPLQTSDFFGYYYRINVGAKLQTNALLTKGQSVLAATTGPSVNSTQTSILADALQPISATSLIAVKAVNTLLYKDITTNPASGGTTGVTGIPGPSGANGADGVPGATGPRGPAGAAGSNGTNGTNGTNGSNGSNGANGTSFVDVMTAIGDIVIRDGTNTTTRLGAGTAGQVLTINGGIPAWENAIGGSSFSALTSGTNTTGLFVVGSGSSLSTTGSGTITATNFSGILPIANGGTGVGTFTLNGVLFGNNTSVIQTTSAPTSGQILLGNGSGIPVFTTLSNDATINGSGAVTLKNVGTAGTYGSALLIPIFTTDAQGRITGVVNTAIAGLTTTNFTSGNISQWTNDSGYITSSSSSILTNKTIAAGSNTITGLTNANLSGSAGITNANLANSSLTVSAGTGLSGGGLVALGGTVTLSLSNVGTSGTYGSGITIPVFTTDAQGRITGVTPTTISGLTVSNFGSALISQWTNDAGYITATGSAVLTNKTLSGLSNTFTNIPNSALTNSSINVAGNSGSGSVALGGTLTLTGAGIATASASGSTLTLTATEADTLQSVYSRGNTITTTTGRNIAFILPSGLVSPTSLTLANNGTGDSVIITDATNTNIDSTTRRSLYINPGAITQNTALSTGTYSGLDIVLPALTLTSGTALTGNGIRVTTDGLTQTAGTLTENGLLVDSTSSVITTGGTLNGIKINAPTTQPSVGIYNNLFLGTSASAVANTQDKATIAVGNIASTATNNFATLNITNGGTGYLDVELMRGFINMRGMNTLYDDFTNNTLDTSKWTTTASGGGSSCSILSGGVGGLLRMIAGNGGANRACELSTKSVTALNTGYYQTGNNPVFETRVSVADLTNDVVYAGFTDTRAPLTNTDTNANTNHAYFAKRSTDTNWQCVTDDGGATESYVDTGVAISTGVFYRLRVEVRNGATPETICTVDNGTTITRVTNTAHQPLTTSPMDAYLQIDVNANTTAKIMDVDLVRVWQDDPVGGLVVDSSPSMSSVLAAEATPSALPIETLAASDSATLIVNAFSNFLHNLVEFFGQVIFHADVTFLGHATVNQDTAGHAIIKSGDTEVRIAFNKEYAHIPVVTVSSNLVGEVTQDQIPAYTVYDLSTKGFTIKLSHVASVDVNFSWIALGVDQDVPSQSVTTALPTGLVATPTTSAATPTQIPPVTPTNTPATENVTQSTASGSASGL